MFPGAVTLPLAARASHPQPPAGRVHQPTPAGRVAHPAVHHRVVRSFSLQQT